MSIEIKCIEKDREYEVNGKTVYLDRNQNWIADIELSYNEVRAFHSYRKAVIENKELKKHPKATFKY